MITIVGPTASGKTVFAAHLAERIGSEVISADSRQVYQGMDIGTGKDLSDYEVNGKHIPYHLIDILPAGAKYNLFDFQHDFHKVYADMLKRGIKQPILCGGTGMYVESVLRGYHLPDVKPNEKLREQLKEKTLDELTDILTSYGPLHNKTDVDSAQRAIRAIEIAEYIKQDRENNNGECIYTEFSPIESLIFCTDLSRDERRVRISERLKKRIDEGMTSEVEDLLRKGVTPEELIYYGLEYKFVTRYVTNIISYQEMIESLEIAIHQFAKRQMTWFRGMEKRGFTLHKIPALAPMSEKIERALEIIQQYHYEY